MKRVPLLVVAVTWLLFVLLQAVGNHGCASSQPQQAAALTAVARQVNASQTVLLRTYEAEGLAAIQAAATREEAEAALRGVRERWRPIWAAVDTFSVAHDAWATSVENGGAFDATELLASYCALQPVLGDLVSLPWEVCQ
jgi:hypothetical protein